MFCVIFCVVFLDVFLSVSMSVGSVSFSVRVCSVLSMPSVRIFASPRGMHKRIWGVCIGLVHRPLKKHAISRSQAPVSNTRSTWPVRLPRKENDCTRSTSC